MEQVVIVGAGPCGLSAALELQNVGIDPLVVEKESIVHSIYSYPTYLQFFSTPELLEIGGIPFSTPNDKPTRAEALHYYRNVALRRNVRIRSYERVTSVVPTESGFRVGSVDRAGREASREARYVVIATGYFDHPNMLGIPGEQLSKVSHFFREAHPYTSTKVAIIGGNNSAVDAAMELVRVGAEVTVVYRGDAISPSVKPWVRPLFESLVNKGRIRMLFGSRVVAIDETHITIDRGGTVETAENDFVLALTGFRPDREFLKSTGIRMEGEREKPYFDPETMETNVPGLYLAGVIAAGAEANEIFIETGRHHGAAIAKHIASRPLRS
ncbi:YpdA family putative bacillithiol disulfide reductase [Paenibacillus flagellatus]|uniref:YpdA family putative bacillithiol disulfide reductase n=1 Tax=Paenibacillus flagellatus TaxID=2211139 RepID=A0A2V5K6T5_9BACL|nr:YpdA family putative bacillithiol disulfide reductase [Paenibacillus flagellatus]PYI55159.1 YpdA family putative bacillithiol disulfide reductase [Paenibacillus flagellatus]